MTQTMKLYEVSDSFTRPADTSVYGSGDLVANSTTAGSVVPLTFGVGDGGFKIVEWQILKSDATVTNADFDLHLYHSSPTPSNGDNGAWLTDAAADYLGRLAGAQMVAFSDGGAFRNALAVGDIVSDFASGSIYGLLEAQAAYSPASAEVFTVSLTIESW